MAGLRRIGNTLADIPFNVYNADGTLPANGRVVGGNVSMFPANQITEWTLATTDPGGTQGANFTTTGGDNITTGDFQGADGNGNARFTLAIEGSSARIITDAFDANPNIFVLGNIYTVTSVDTNTSRTVIVLNRPWVAGSVPTTGNRASIFMVENYVAPASSFPDTAGAGWTAARNAITGIDAFNFTLANNAGLSPTTSRIHVLRDFNFLLNTTGSFGNAADGTHVCFVNSYLLFTDFTGASQGRYLVRERAAGATFPSGTSPLGRPLDFTSGTIDANRSMNFYSCDLVLGDVSTANSDRRVNLAVGDCFDSTFRFLEPNVNTSGSSAGLAIYPKPGAIWNNVSMQDINGRTGDVATLFATGATVFIDTDIRGFAFQVADIARVKAFGLVQAADGLVAGFNSGNVDTTAELNAIPYGNLGWFKSVNPTRVLPSTSHSGTISFTSSGIPAAYRNAQRYVELQQWIPDFNETLTTKADGINIQVTNSHSFTNPQDYTTLSATPNVRNYSTDANGGISGSVYIPDEGQVGTVSNSDGLQIPVATYGTNSTTNGTSTVDNIDASLSAELDIRSYFHNYEATLTINKALLDARVAGEDVGTAIVDSSLAPINPFMRDAALYSSGTTKRSAGSKNTYITALFAGATPTRSAQDIYEVLVWHRTLSGNSGYFAGFNRPIVNSTNYAQWDGNIQLNSTSNLVFTSSTNTLQLTGAGLEREDGDLVAGLQVTSLDANGGPILENVNSTITNVRTTSSLPNENRGTDYDLQGVIDGIINLSVNSDVTLYVNITSNGLTINNTGTGTVTIRTNQVPAAGATTSIANVTAGTNVVFEATDAVVNVREPIIARFTNVPAGANWKLIEFSGDEYNRIAPNAGNILARSADNDTAARNGTVLNFRTTFPDASGSDIAVPMDQRTNAAYRGLEIAALGPGINTRVALVVTGAAISGSVSFLTLPTTFNTRATTADPNPATGVISSVSQTITTITALGDETAAVVRIPASGNDRRAELLVSGYSNSVAGERKAGPTISNAILAAARDHSNYPVAIWNAFGIGDSDSYPQNLIATGENISVPYDIINTRATNSVDIRQGTYQFFGVDSLTSSSPNLIGQGLQSVYEVQNNALLSPLELTDANRLAGLSVDNISVDAIADNSFHIRQGDASTGPETPTVISDERALTVDALAGVGLSEEQVTTIVQTDGNRTRRNIPPPS